VYPHYRRVADPGEVALRDRGIAIEAGEEKLGAEEKHVRAAITVARALVSMTDSSREHERRHRGQLLTQ
jgi:hypothetical protein